MNARPDLRLRNSTAIVVSPGEIGVTRAGTTRVVRHPGIAPRSWPAVRTQLLGGDGWGQRPGRSERSPRRGAEEHLLVACLARAGALVPDRWWAELPACHLGLRDFLEAAYDDPRAALVALRSVRLGVWGGGAARQAIDLLTGWGLTALPGPVADPSTPAVAADVVIGWRPTGGQGARGASWVTAGPEEGLRVRVTHGSGEPPRAADALAPAGDDDDVRARVLAAVAALGAVRMVCSQAERHVDPDRERHPWVAPVAVLPPAGRAPLARAPLRPAGDLRAFVHRQADPERAMTGPGGGAGRGSPAAPPQPAVPPRPPGGVQGRRGGPAVRRGDRHPARRTVAGLRNDLAAVPFPDGRLAAATSLQGYSDRRDQLLQAALGWLRYEPGQPFNPHAAYPSPRSVFTSQAWWCDDDGCHSWDPASRTLAGPPDAAACPAPHVLLKCVPQRLPEHYGALRWALSLLEQGHAAETTAVVGQALGWDVAVGVGAGQGDVSARVDLRQPARGAAGRPGAGGEPSWWEVLLRRSSGHGWGSLVADHGRVAHSAVAAVVAAVAASWQRRWGPVGPGGSAPDVRLITERVAGLRDGVHRLSLDPADPAPLAMLRRGARLHELQEAFRYPREVMDLTSMNAALVISWDVDRVADLGGEHGLAAAQVQTGALAQAACLAASAAGLFCRPARSFDPGRLRACAVPLPALTPSYLCLLGRDRAHDLSVHLGPVRLARSGEPT